MSDDVTRMASDHLPPHPVEPMAIAKVTIDRETTALYQLAAGTGVERWRHLAGHPVDRVALPMWASWEQLHEIGVVTVLREIPPAPAAGVDGERHWPDASRGWAERRVAAVAIPDARVVSIGAGNGFADLTPAHARELAATLLDLASEVDAANRADPATAAVHEAVDRRG